MTRGGARGRAITAAALRRQAVWLSVLLISCAGDPETLLVLDLRTDMLPGSEFDRVETELVGGPDLKASRAVARGDVFIEGSRIAEIEGVPEGDRTALVSLMLGDEAIVSRRLSFKMRKTRSITVVITRDCTGVSCESSGTFADACLAGRCVDARCAPETPEFCPTSECTEDAECASETACVDPRCNEGICLFVPADSSCDSGLVCHPERGCVLDGPPPGLCESGETRSPFCAGEGVARCAEGELVIDEACPHLCAGTPPGCSTFLPSNVERLLTFPDSTAIAELVVGEDGADWTVNSDNGSISTASGTVVRAAGEGLIDGVLFRGIPMPGSPTETAGVFVFSRLTVLDTHVLRGIGSRPLLVLVNSTIVVEGTIDVGALAGFQYLAGPGGWDGVLGGYVDGAGPGSGQAGEAELGGGGGGFGGPGGHGTSDPVREGGLGGVPYATPELVPLLGGSSGGNGADTYSPWSGAGGGALQLVAAEEIVVRGRIGSPGGQGRDRCGGGAGGAILLEAPSVRLSPIAFVTANGGGGGARGVGQRGSLSAASAPGGGGIGGLGSDPWGVGGDGRYIDGAAGGGGGGRIRINTASGSADIEGTVFPIAESGLFTQGRLLIE